MPLKVRALLELLGIIEPDDARREPVALPAWVRRARPLLVWVLALLSTLGYGLLRAILV
jgi:hypothetical protein